MRIAMCDDESTVLDSLQAFLLCYAEEQKLEFTIDRFSSGEEFLSKAITYDIVFMDIYLSGINGTDVIKKISAANRQQVVFVTTSREHAIEAFHLGATHYLLKPLTRENVTEATERCLIRLGQHPTKTLEIKTAEGNICVLMDNIRFIEVYNKVCIVHTIQNEFRTYTSLDALYELLDANSFLRAQRSFVVNMNFIDSFLFDRLIMKDGVEIMLSRGNRADLKKQYQRFLFDMTRRDRI